MPLPMTCGVLASNAGYMLPIEVCQSKAGFYIGTYDDDGPVSRESVEYWPTEELAEAALASGEWLQRSHP